MNPKTGQRLKDDFDTLGKPHLNSMTPPTKDGFGQQGVTPICIKLRWCV